jgi:hypothetical protein
MASLLDLEQPAHLPQDMYGWYDRWSNGRSSCD